MRKERKERKKEKKERKKERKKESMPACTLPLFSSRSFPLLSVSPFPTHSLFLFLPSASLFLSVRENLTQDQQKKS